MSNIKNLSISDIEVLAQLSKMTSIRSFAQNLGITPSFLSKKIRKLEDSLGYRLINRSSKGISTTKESQPAIKLAKEIIEKVNDINLGRASEVQRTPTLTVGTRGFLNTALATTLLNHFSSIGTEIQFRFIDMSPNDQLNSALSNEVDILIGLKELNFGELWITNKIGDLKWSIFSRKHHPLSNSVEVSLEKILVYPFTKPSYWDGESVVTIEDSIPLDGSKIRYGHGVQNTQTAISVISSSNHLCYIPTVSAKRSVELQEICELNINSLEPKRDPVYLSIHSERVTSSVYKELQSTLAKTFSV